MPSIYQRIITDLAQAIDQGFYQPSDKLPSVRQLSQTYHCSKDTVQKALLELKYRHYIYPVLKSGYYVLERKQADQETISLPLSEIRLTAYEDFRLCLNETLVGREAYLFNYYDQQEGLRDLIQSIHHLLLDSYVYANQDQIVITSGTQQALYSLLQIPFPNHKTDILLEQPTYHRMNELVSRLKLPYRTIKRDLKGLDLEELEVLFQTHPIKFFYTMPRFHQPLGTAYQDKEKAELVKLAQRYDVYLVEDDYMADFDHKAAAPLHYYDTHQRVIYIKSFSKSIFPSLRLAAVALPPSLKKEFLAAKSLMDYDTNLIMQKALSLYIDNGMFAKNKEDRRRLYKKEEQDLADRLTKIPVPWSYHLFHHSLIFDPKTWPKVPQSLRHLIDPLNTSYLRPQQASFQALDLSQEKSITVLEDWIRGLS